MQYTRSRLFTLVWAGIFMLALLGTAAAQSPDSEEQDRSGPRATNRSSHTTDQFKGFNEYEEFQGAVTSSEGIFKLDSTLGYDFNRYAGVFVGVPLYFVNDFSADSGSGAGDVCFGLELYAPVEVVRYSTSFTVSAPTGSVSKGFSTGHRTLDWTNRLRKRFGRLTPFLTAGLSNTVPDTDLVTRTFTSLGNVVHLEEGADFDLTKHVYAGASGYHIIPFGNQEVFNRFNGTTSTKADNANRGPGSDDQPSASGNDLTRENGFNTWLGFEPTRVLRIELGYSRSMTFQVNRGSVNVGLNVGRMLRSLGHQD